MLRTVPSENRRRRVATRSAAAQPAAAQPAAAQPAAVQPAPTKPAAAKPAAAQPAPAKPADKATVGTRAASASPSLQAGASPWVYVTITEPGGIPLMRPAVSGEPDPLERVGVVSGRTCLFYPMIKDDDGAVYMEHRLVNSKTGEMQISFAQIQGVDGPPRVSEFCIHP